MTLVLITFSVRFINYVSISLFSKISLKYRFFGLNQKLFWDFVIFSWQVQ